MKVCTSGFRKDADNQTNILLTGYSPPDLPPLPLDRYCPYSAHAVTVCLEHLFLDLTSGQSLRIDLQCSSFHTVSAPASNTATMSALF